MIKFFFFGGWSVGILVMYSLLQKHLLSMLLMHVYYIQELIPGFQLVTHKISKQLLYGLYWKINWHHRQSIIVYSRRERARKHGILISYTLTTRGSQDQNKHWPFHCDEWCSDKTTSLMCFPHKCNMDEKQNKRE